MTSHDECAAENNSAAGNKEGAARNRRPDRQRDCGGEKPARNSFGVLHSDGDGVRSFGVVRSLAWAALALTILLSALVAVYLGNSANNTLISKNHNFATLLADNLNNQIYRRFTQPTVSIFGRIALRNPEQYKQLEQVIQSIIQGLHVEDVRIYSEDHTVAYSSNSEELGRKDLASPDVDRASSSAGPIFRIQADTSYWRAFISLNLEPESFRMRTTFPLRIENQPGAPPDGLLMGVMEFTQDISGDIESGIRFQQIVLAATLVGSGMLMCLLLLLVRRAERALALRMSKEQRLLLELHQHEKLAGMGRVVASIAHEIRNPLGIISSSAELLLKRQTGADQVTARILQAIYDEAKRLSRTVSDFLDYARPRQPNQELVDISAIITQAMAFLASELTERDIGVVRAGELDDPLWVLGDKDLLYRAFYNIMSNAIQAMGASGTLTITLGRSADPPEVILVFHDSGPGFPGDSKDRLLDPFFTTKDDGTGLGLPIVNTIITSHQGTLVLDNARDGGAEARVTLPAAPEQFVRSGK